MHGECGELPWPWPGAPLSEVFVVELTIGGVIPGWGHDSLCLPRQSQREQGLLNVAFSGPMASFLKKKNKTKKEHLKNEAGVRTKTKPRRREQQNPC